MELLKKDLTRRHFIRVTSLVGGGMLVACGGGGGGGGGSAAGSPVGGGNPGTNNQDPPADPVASGVDSMQNAFIRIAENNVVTIIVGPSEVGQGPMTALPQIVADELDADWSLVKWEQSPVSIEYGIPAFNGIQITAASISVRSLWNDLRVAGAAARELLVAEAANRFGVDPSTLTTANSFVTNPATGAKISYGELASAAATAAEANPLPPSPTLKGQEQFNIIGSSVKRLDGPEKADGSPIYGYDFELPDMKIVMVARPPRFGDQVQSFDDEATLQVPGVIEVQQIPFKPGIPAVAQSGGVAVLAEDFWSAKKGLEALQVVWTGGDASINSADLKDQYDAQNALPVGDQIVRSDGLPYLITEAQAASTFDENFYFPYITHVPMEPLNVIIDYRGPASASADIWCGTQWPDFDRRLAASTLGLTELQVNFNVLLGGGGFGRRGTLGFDFIIEAAECAKLFERPIKVCWQRFDDVQGGYYRPAAAIRMRAALDAENNIIGWAHKITSQTIFINNAALEFGLRAYTEEVQSTQGGREMAYNIPNVLVESNSVSASVTTMWVRSVSNSVNVYAVEHFLDQIARQTNKDPYQIRRELLVDAPSSIFRPEAAAAPSRYLNVLDVAANTIGWNNPPPAGRSRGIAVFSSYDSAICQIFEVSVSSDREVTIHRSVSAVDVGIAVNPDLVKAQIESGIVFGLGTAMFQEIVIEDGLVQNSNFDDFQVLRMNQCPPMEIILTNAEGHEVPGGAGELGVPCVAPALANAISAALNGEMFYELPLIKNNLTFAGT